MNEKASIEKNQRDLDAPSIHAPSNTFWKTSPEKRLEEIKKQKRNESGSVYQFICAPLIYFKAHEATAFVNPCVLYNYTEKGPFVKSF